MIDGCDFETFYEYVAGVRFIGVVGKGLMCSVDSFVAGWDGAFVEPGLTLAGFFARNPDSGLVMTTREQGDGGVSYVGSVVVELTVVELTVVSDVDDPEAWAKMREACLHLSMSPPEIVAVGVKNGLQEIWGY